MRSAQAAKTSKPVSAVAVVILRRTGSLIVGTSLSFSHCVAHIATTLCMLHKRKARFASVTRVTADVSRAMGAEQTTVLLTAKLSRGNSAGPDAVMGREGMPAGALWLVR